MQASPEAICNNGCRYLSRAAGLNLFLPYMHFCGLAKGRSISVIHNQYSHLCRVAEGLSDHQALARLSTAANSGRLLRPSRLLSIGSAALVAGSTLSKVAITASLLPWISDLHPCLKSSRQHCIVRAVCLYQPNAMLTKPGEMIHAKVSSTNLTPSVQARAATQQTRSPVTRLNATSQDQTLSDSTADSSSSAVRSEPPANGSSNGHLSPQEGSESNGYVSP